MYELGIFILILVLIIILIVVHYYFSTQPSSTSSSSKSDNILLDTITPKTSNINTFIESTGNNFENISKIVFKKYDGTELNVDFVVISNKKLYLKTPNDIGIYTVYYIFKDESLSNSINIEIVNA